MCVRNLTRRFDFIVENEVSISRVFTVFRHSEYASHVRLLDESVVCHIDFYVFDFRFFRHFSRKIFLLPPMFRFFLRRETVSALFPFARIRMIPDRHRIIAVHSCRAIDNRYISAAFVFFDIHHLIAASGFRFISLFHFFFVVLLSLFFDFSHPVCKQVDQSGVFGRINMIFIGFILISCRTVCPFSVFR